MNLNEAIKTLKTAGYLVESVKGYYDLCQYLNDSLREEKIGTAWYDGNSIKITDINERLTVCDIFFDEDDICVSCDGELVTTLKGGTFLFLCTGVRF